MFIVNFLVTAISVVAVGAATGLGLHLYGQMPPVLAGVSAIVVVTGLFEIYALASRGKRATYEHLKFNGLLKANAALSEEIVSLRQDMETQKRAISRLEDSTVQTLNDRITPVETSLEQQAEHIDAVKAVNGELTEGAVQAGKRLANLTKQVRRLEKRTRKQKEPSKPIRNLTQQPSGVPAQTQERHKPDSAKQSPLQKTGPDTETVHMDAKPEVPETDTNLVETIRKAIESGSSDLYLQPVVTLPQRKVRYYEALTRLRSGETVFEPKDFMTVAESEGLIQTLDNMALYRSIQVLRRLSERGRNVGMFCNLSHRSLIDSSFFNQMLEFLSDNRELSQKLVFEFPQHLLDNGGPMEIESLRALNSYGFRFSLDQVNSLNLDFQHLNDLGFRFVKVDSDILLNRMEETDTWVHTADLSALMERHGLSLIAEKVESERMVLNLLDYDINLAQGHLFGKPAQVRMDILGDQQRAATPLRMAI